MVSRSQIERAERAVRARERSGTSRSGLQRPRLPNIVEFVSSDQYLGRLALYPRQLLLLKLIFLAFESLSDDDYRVINRWAAGFTMPDEPGRVPRYEGTEGVVPDVIDRMRRLRAEGRLWFRDVVLVIGRRGGKGHLGAICAAYLLYWYITQGDLYLDVDVRKTIDVIVFAGNKTQAIDNLWSDVVNLIMSAPCFAPYRVEPTRDTLCLCSHLQTADGRRPSRRQAKFRVVAAETTERSVRGKTVAAAFLDEMAHMVAAGANRPASEIWGAATPALAQCGEDGKYAFAFQPSSPASMTGQFFANYQAALQFNPATGEAVHYDTLMVQLPSWAMYEDYALTQAGDLEMSPGGPTFVPLSAPIIALDARLRREREADPENFDTEYGARWRVSQDHYLPVDDVEAVFRPYGGELLTLRRRGVPAFEYHAHADAASTNANFAVAVGHAEPSDDDGLPHIFFDYLHHWSPDQFADRKINYNQVQRELRELLDDFQFITDFTFDQYNDRLLIENLQDHAEQHGRPVRTQVYEQTATKSRNLEAWELLKRAVLAGRIHAPPYELARLELMFLRRTGDRIEHQPFGPVTTDDIAVAMANVVWRILTDKRYAQRLSAITPHFSQRGGFDVPVPRDGFSTMALAPEDDLARRFSRAGRPRSSFGHAAQPSRRRGSRGGGRPRR